MNMEDTDVIFIKGALSNKIGKLVWDGQTLSFYKKNMLVGASAGLIGLLLEKWLKKEKFKLEFTFAKNNMASVETGTHGQNKNVLLIKDQAQTVYKFVVNQPVAQWVSALQTL